MVWATERVVRPHGFAWATVLAQRVLADNPVVDQPTPAIDWLTPLE